jgi:hypothetical protein
MWRPGCCQFEYHNIEHSQNRVDVVNDPTAPTSTSGRRHLQWWTRGTSNLYSAKPGCSSTSTLMYACADTLTSSPHDALRCCVNCAPSVHRFISTVVYYADFGVVIRSCCRGIFQYPVLIGCKLSRMPPLDCLILNIRRTEHMTDSLICQHYLRLAERKRLNVAAVTTHHDILPRYIHCITTAFTR